MKLLLFVILLSTSFNLKACDCKRITFKGETDNSDLIFRGSIIMKIDSPSIWKFYYTFSISQIWKGQIEKTIVISSSNNPTCGVNFEIGKEYIIYSKDGQINLCGRNELYNVATSLPMLNYKYRQNDFDHYGNDNSEVLNSFESSYFNSVFDNSRYEPAPNKTQINFTKRKVAYLINDTIVSKKRFFELNRMYEPSLYFHKFNDKQVAKNGGYIGVIYLDKKLKISKMSIHKKLNG